MDWTTWDNLKLLLQVLGVLLCLFGLIRLAVKSGGRVPVDPSGPIHDRIIKGERKIAEAQQHGRDLQSQKSEEFLRKHLK